jgi:hypothetical protein
MRALDYLVAERPLSVAGFLGAAWCATHSRLWQSLDVASTPLSRKRADLTRVHPYSDSDF